MRNSKERGLGWEIAALARAASATA